jgi:hypothetical protein
MTAAEFQAAETLPPYLGWMACNFSCYGLSLSNLPRTLPEGAMVIVNDRTPVDQHDPEVIVQQLLSLIDSCKPKYFLLDLQRPGALQTTQIVRLLVQQLPCPVGISPAYADELDCPVFLPPPPLHRPLKEYLTPWLGRPIWLEAALSAQTVTVTAEGSRFEPVQMSELPEPAFCDDVLHCRYHIDCRPDAAVFTLQRDNEHLENMLEEAELLGVELAVGLYQELGSI